MQLKTTREAIHESSIKGAAPKELSLVESNELAIRQASQGAFSPVTRMLELSFVLFTVFYIYFFWKSVSPYWFHPYWTTDDSLQQVFPFHKVLHPEIFANDLITQMIEGYLTPIHYWLCYGITLLTKDVIMMSHWMMLIQVALGSVFLFLCVKHKAGLIPAVFSVAWLFHTRHIMQRLTGGLPRGWAVCVLLAYLYFVFKRNHRAVLATIFVGCLLHPPSTLIVAVSYGLLLLFEWLQPVTRQAAFKNIKVLMLFSPLFVALVLYVLHRPPEIGKMASYEQALRLEEFKAPKGRFPFVPLEEPTREIKVYGFQAFVTRFYNPGRLWKKWMPILVITTVVLLLLSGMFSKRKLISADLVTFLFAIFSVYMASRIFAFKLYVPNRHLQFPLAIFCIVSFSIAVWKLFEGVGQQQAYRGSSGRAGFGAIGLVLLGILIYAGSGTGFYGTANFNYSMTKKGNVWFWVKDTTPMSALIAGEPTHIDAVQLFGVRQGFVTTETAHPFYNAYNQEMRRRLEISLRAHYARDLLELYQILKPEKIDYFIFDRKKFYPKALEQATYYPPFDRLVHELASRPSTEYAYKKLPTEVDLKAFPFMPFKDEWSAVVDLKKLREYLNESV